MDFPYLGYAGKYLRVDLSSRKVEARVYDAAIAENFLGGNGFGTKILWDEVGPEIDPFDERAVLIISTGPLCGTLVPNPSRVEVIAKSPLTGGYGDSNSGGLFGPELKFAGWDAVVIRGCAEEPVYLLIIDDQVSIRSAKSLWGLSTRETEARIRQEHSRPALKTAIIGPAGENKVRFAGIQMTPQRSAARAGMGAVMGSKNLKAIAVQGSGPVKVAQPKALRDHAFQMQERLRNHPIYEAVHRYGTPGITSLMSTLGRFPSRNFQDGSFRQVDRIDAEALEKRAFVRHLACFNCPVGCDKLFRVPGGPYQGTELRSVEYENLNALGGGVDNCDLDAILKANQLCDDYGLDTISAGRAIAFGMELWERGILTVVDTGGLQLEWGKVEVIHQLLGMIARREGFGRLLGEGVKRAAEEIGRGAGQYAMHVRGMEIPGQDGRAQRSMGLAHVTSTRGADHLKAFPTIDEVSNPEDTLRRFGPQYLPEMADPLQTKYKPLLVKDGEDFGAIIDSVGMCKSGGTHVFVEFYWQDIARAIEYATGMPMTAEKLQAIGERIYNLQRSYNAVHGFTRIDDRLPLRFREDPSPSGNARGQVFDVEPLLEEYYTLRGWDHKSGWPTPETLNQLNLEDASLRLWGQQSE